MRETSVTVTEYLCDFCQYRSSNQLYMQRHENQHKGCEHKEKTYRYLYDKTDGDITGIEETCEGCDEITVRPMKSWDQELAKKIWDLLGGKT